MADERDQVLGHAEDNDGIDEYDNPLPAWWVGLFVVTVVWGVGYAIDYHFVRHRSQASMYEAEMAAAAQKWPVKQVAAGEVDMSPEAIAAGKAIFDTNCVACHGANLEGGIGPNLVDEEWIHGGEMADIIHTITEGVPDKGMVTWGPILGPEKIAQVAAYIVDAGKKK